MNTLRSRALMTALCLTLVPSCSKTSDEEIAAEKVAEALQQAGAAGAAAAAAGEAAAAVGAQAAQQAAQGLAQGAKAMEGAEGQVQAAMAQAAQAMGQAAQALGQPGGAATNDVVNWRKLAPLLPDELGGFKAGGEVSGSTNAMGAMKVSQVKRRYARGSQELEVEIIDAWLASMMRTGFAMAMAINEDSSEGMKKGLKLEGNPAILDWRKADKRGELTLLAANRFVVKLELQPTEDPEEVLQVVKALALAKLADLK